MHNNYGRDFFVDVYNHLAYMALQHNRNNKDKTNVNTSSDVNKST